MKFAENGYYIEKYIKCDNCGVLIYDLAAAQKTPHDLVFCTAWCGEWHTQKQAGVDSPQVTLAFDE